MLWGLLGLYLVGMAWLAWQLVTAPVGYEDESGFHYEKRDTAKAKSEKLSMDGV